MTSKVLCLWMALPKECAILKESNLNGFQGNFTHKGEESHKHKPAKIIMPLDLLAWVLILLE